jgi:hypothetical protein
LILAKNIRKAENSEERMAADFLLVLAESVRDESWSQDSEEVFWRAVGKKLKKSRDFTPALRDST